MTIGVVIVSWNSAEVIDRTLQSCLRFPELEIVVVDNASSDDTAERARQHRGITVIANCVNRGFAGGANQGVAALAHCPAVLLLNPDAELLTDVDDLARAAVQPGAGAASGKLIGLDGRTQQGFQVRRFATAAALAAEALGFNRLFPWNPWNRDWRMHGFDDASAAEVEQPAGAFLMLNRDAWTAVGGLDERFQPAWFEDVDLCFRLKQASYSIHYVPSAVARHVGGHSALRLKWSQRQLFWYSNLLQYATKHFSASDRRIVAAAVMIASVPRSLSALLSGRSLRSVSVYIEVFRAALAAFGGSMKEYGALNSGPPRGEKQAKRNSS